MIGLVRIGSYSCWARVGLDLTRHDAEAGSRVRMVIHRNGVFSVSQVGVARREKNCPALEHLLGIR
jgi:hypothetical protein